MMTAMLTVENIVAGRRLYDTWCVNEDAEYHEAGEEGADKAPPVAARPEAPRVPLHPAASPQPVSADQAAALASVRDVPKRIVRLRERRAA